MRFALARMSCAGAWAWGEVPERLREAGHEVDAPDFALRAGATPADDAAQFAGSADVVAAIPTAAWWRRWPRSSDFAEQAQRARERGWTVLRPEAEHLLPLIDPAFTAKVLLDVADSVRPAR